MKPNKILFMGTPDFAVPIAEALFVGFPTQFCAVTTRPDAPAGRGRTLHASPVKQWARQHGLEIHTPETAAEITAIVNQIKPDLIIVVAYGMILPKAITDQFLCINIHGSLLPKYRGASPIHAALLNLDKETGITLIKMTEKMDAGPILHQSKIKIENSDILLTLRHRLREVAAREMVDYIQKHIIPVQITETVQDESHASYCKKIDKNELLLDFKQSVKTNLGKIKAFAPDPGAYVLTHGKRVKIMAAHLENDTLIFDVVKPEGKKEMSYHDYLLGNPAIL